MKSSTSDGKRSASRSEKAGSIVWKFRPRQSGRDHGNSTKPPGIAVEGCERSPIIGAMRASVNDDGAINPQCGMELHQVFVGAVLGRVAALVAEGEFSLRSKDMNVRVAGARRHCEGRTFRVAVGAGAGLQRTGLMRVHGSSVTCR